MLYAFYLFLPFIFNYKFYMHVNLLDWADENQLKCKKLGFFQGNEWNFLEWYYDEMKLFKRVRTLRVKAKFMHRDFYN